MGVEIMMGASYLKYRLAVCFPCAIANIFASYTLSILVPQKNYPIKIQNRSLMNGMHLFQPGLWWGILIVIWSVQFSFHYSLAVLIEFGCMLIFVWLFVSSVNWWFQEVGSCIFCLCDKHNFGWFGSRLRSERTENVNPRLESAVHCEETLPFFDLNGRQEKDPHPISFVENNASNGLAGRNVGITVN